MYSTWSKPTTRMWAAALLLLVTAAAALGGIQTVAAQSAVSAASSRPTRLMLPLMMNQAMSAAEPVVAFAAEAAPTGGAITTDLSDYPPGAMVTVIGTGWAPGEAVDIFVNDSGGQTWSLHSDPDPVADLAGEFTYQFQLPNWFVANYAVLATGTTSGSATTTFTDVSIGTYDQCSNDTGTGYTTGDTGCRWINGNLQSNNSAYTEGDATVQRVWLTEYVPGSAHTVTFNYGTTKGGKHAYDFLTTWNWSEGWITLADLCQDITGCTTANDSTLDIPQDPNVPDSFEPSAPGARQFVMRGGTLTSATTPAISSGTYGGDSDTAITVSFTVPDSGPLCSTKNNVTTCDVALWFGAHVAAQSDWGIGTAAGNISGSPYHVALSAIDGSAVGQRDNQMQAGAVVLNGTIVIFKDAVPNDAQDFNFTLSNGTTINQNFYLDDDSDPTLPNSQTFSVPPGTWSAAEVFPLPTNWTLTNLVCTDPTNNTTVNVGTGVASINLASAETVTCTYADTRDQGYLKLSKTFDPKTSGFTGTFPIVYNCGAGDQTVNLPAGGSTTVGPFSPGTSCTVSEPTLQTAPSGWMFGTPSISGSPATIVKSDQVSAVNVTVTNSIAHDLGYLKISKTFDPKNSGYSGTFAIVYNCGAGDQTVNLPAGGSTTVGPFDIGTSCSVSEPTLPTAPIGWTSGTPVITGSPATIGKDTTVEVTVANSIARILGSLQITKIVDWNGAAPDTSATFEICIVGPSFASGDCKVAGYNGGVLTWSGLVPGAYTVVETDPGNAWQVTVDSSSVTVPSDGGQGQTTVTNTRLADPRITVTKVVTETSLQQWSFVLRLDGGDPKTVTEDQPQAVWENLEANRTYTLSEDEPGAGWVEGSFDCKVNGVSVGEPLPDGDLQLSVVPGDDVVCTKYNADISGTDLDPIAEPGTVFGVYLPAITR